MALPELTAPPGAPAFKAEGLALTPDGVYAHFKTRTGHQRKRRRYTAADSTLAVSWRLTASQMELVDAWAEDQLHAYSRRFSARIDNLGPGIVWYEAQWAEPFEARPAGGHIWTVTGTLWLFGAPSVLPPVSTSLELGIAVRLAASAAIVSTARLELGVVAALQAQLVLL